MNPRKFIIEWNNKYPLDREWRRKHNVTFGSAEHRAVSQYQIYLEWLEEQLYLEAYQHAEQQIEREKELEKGIWLREAKLDENVAADFFDKISISDIPDDAPIQFEQ